MVDDDDSDGFPSPEPRTDSKSALPRGFRAWWRLCIVKHDEFFSLIFSLPETQYMELELESERQQGAHEVGGAPPPSWRGGGPPGLHLLQVFFFFSEKWLREVSAHLELCRRSFFRSRFRAAGIPPLGVYLANYERKGIRITPKSIIMDKNIINNSKKT